MPDLQDRSSTSNSASALPARVSIYDAADANRRRTWFLILLFVAFIATLGYLLGDIWTGDAAGGFFVLPFALGISAISAFASYYAGDKLVLSISQARPVSERDEPVLHNVVEALAIGDGIPKPDLY